MKEKLLDILLTNIIPYWSVKMVDQENGGFYGRMSGEDLLYPEAEKGAILNGRLLWTFSAAYRLLSSDYYKIHFPERASLIESSRLISLQNAHRAKRYLIDNFYDNTYGGVYWSVDYKGAPLNTKKQFYALGFAIYGLSEFYRATGDPEALEYAKKLFLDIERYSFDPIGNGYIEATTRDWQEIKDMRLSDKDENFKKTMNTHLHILEPYTNLYRVWKSDDLKRQLVNLVNIFLDKILDKSSHHLGLFFDENWVRHGNEISYGHDIEASWLILEAAQVIADKDLLSRVVRETGLIAHAAMEGLQEDGSMIYEIRNNGVTDRDRHWWVQAETLLGLVYLDKYHRDNKAAGLASRTLNYISENLVDKKNGEWFWSIKADGTLNKTDDKAGFWKCPYHNSRMCIEALEQLK